MIFRVRIGYTKSITLFFFLTPFLAINLLVVYLSTYIVYIRGGVFIREGGVTIIHLYIYLPWHMRGGVFIREGGVTIINLSSYLYTWGVEFSSERVEKISFIHIFIYLPGHMRGGVFIGEGGAAIICLLLIRMNQGCAFTSIPVLSTLPVSYLIDIYIDSYIDR